MHYTSGRTLTCNQEVLMATGEEQPACSAAQRSPGGWRCPSLELLFGVGSGGSLLIHR